ncbi:hypothetical protein [Rahnella inusitata]|uniref:hypothetical protein n=1 Tax=Rahnella inusitata TaxID=58169 RepID=UPI0039BE0A81
MSEVKSTAEACYEARIALIKERDELARQVSELQLSQQNIINAFGISGEGAHSKLVIEYVHGLVAESKALKDVVGLTVNNLYASGYDAKQNSMHPWESLIFEGEKAMSTPATDSFTAELRAQGVDEYAQAFSENTNMDFACNRGFYHGALDFAANLRAGRKG